MKAIAVFDIGKTNKKFIVFNEKYEIIFEKGLSFKEVTDEDGYPAEDIRKLEKWIPDTLQKFCENKSYQIVAVNFSGYGASLVHLDSNDQRVSLMYNYLKPMPEEIQKDFFSKYDQDNKFPLLTESPKLGMLNSGLQFYWLKRTKPEIYQKIVTSLHFPEYCSFLISGKKYTQITSIGSHTSLWNFQKNDYHEWVEKEGVSKITAPMISANHHEKVKFHNRDLMVGVGLHDSSASLLPYLKILKSKFVLLSSGTWNISMNPFNDSPLTNHELQQDCLSYISYQGNKVKSSRVFLGNEHEYWRKKLEKHFNKPSGFHKKIKFDPVIINSLLIKEDKDKQFTPKTMKGTGPLPDDYSHLDVNLDKFDSYSEAYHQLTLDLTYIQKLSLDLILDEQIKEIIITGGFTSNEIFLNLLSCFYPNHQIYSSKLSRASALGAAMVLHEDWNEQPIDKELLSFKNYQSTAFLDLKDYRLIEIGSSV